MIHHGVSSPPQIPVGGLCPEMAPASPRCWAAILPHPRQVRVTRLLSLTGAPQEVERSRPRQKKPHHHEAMGPQVEKPLALHGVMPLLWLTNSPR